VQTELPNESSYLLPVSVKGVLVHEGAVCLLFNDRGQWELPGGRLGRGETPAACLRREILEEVGLNAVVEGIADAWVFEPVPGREVFVTVFRCRPDPIGDLRLSDEHSRGGWFDADALATMNLPGSYLASVRRALALRT